MDFSLESFPELQELEITEKNDLQYEIINLILDKTDILLAQRQDPDRDENGMTILHWTARMSMERAIRAILENGLVPVDCVDYSGTTPLMQAAYVGHCPSARILLQYGADPRISTSSGVSASTIAFGKNHTSMIDEFLSCIRPDFKFTIKDADLVAAIGGGALESLVLSKQIRKDLHSMKVNSTPLLGKSLKEVAQLCAQDKIIDKLNMWTANDVLKQKSSVHLLFPDPKSHQSFRSDINTSAEKEGSLLNSKCLQNFRLKGNSPISTLTLHSPKFWKNLKSRASPFKRRRSKSQGRVVSKENISNNMKNFDHRTTQMKYILDLAKLSEYIPLFEKHEVTFHEFIHMNEEDLKLVGIEKAASRKKLSRLIKYYCSIYFTII